MDGTKFDALAKGLATGRTRRSVLRGLIGGGAAVVAARTGTTLAVPQGKVTICHWSEDLGYYELISLSGNAVPAHGAHGDIINPNFTDVNNCGDCNTACEAVDPCTPAACTDDGCNAVSSCDDGVCGDDGCETVSTCSSALLIGFETNSVAFNVCVDDNLRVLVNGEEVAYEGGPFCLPGISLGPVSNGDSITLELIDGFPPCSIEPFQLLCEATEATQVLNADGFCTGGVCGGDWPGGGICYNPTFTVAL